MYQISFKRKYIQFSYFFMIYNGKAWLINKTFLSINITTLEHNQPHRLDTLDECWKPRILVGMWSLRRQWHLITAPESEMMTLTSNDKRQTYWRKFWPQFFEKNLWSKKFKTIKRHDLYWNYILCCDQSDMVLLLNSVTLIFYWTGVGAHNHDFLSQTNCRLERSDKSCWTPSDFNSDFSSTIKNWSVHIGHNMSSNRSTSGKLYFFQIQFWN